MTDSSAIGARTYIESVLTSSAPAAARALAKELGSKYPGSAIFLYGSGISVSASEKPEDILFDFYVIAPDYRTAIPNPLERLAARLIPPNVYYFESTTAHGVLRCKYALLSLPAFERLVSRKTFHSYFWARFAQPCRLVSAPAAMSPRLVAAVETAIKTFLLRSQGLAANASDWREVWLAGMNASYKAELRAEKSDRAARLIENYGEWPQRVAAFALDPGIEASGNARLAWRLRAAAGALLSVARLLKATATFDGGIDYIAWKIKRHAGVDVAVKPWERRWPLAAAPIVAMRYYRLRRRNRANASAKA